MSNLTPADKSSTVMISKKKFLESYSLDNCLGVYKKLSTVDECMESKSPSIGTIIRERGKEFCEGFLLAWILNLNEILNLRRPMTDNQIKLCVKEIMNTYPSLKIADLTLLFKRIMAGEFGEFYESLSIPKVLTFFRDYNDERMNKAEEINMAKHNDMKVGDPFDISKNIRRIWNGTPSK